MPEPKPEPPGPKGPPPPKAELPPHIITMLMELQAKVGKLEGMLEVLLSERKRG